MLDNASQFIHKHIELNRPIDIALMGENGIVKMMETTSSSYSWYGFVLCSFTVSARLSNRSVTVDSRVRDQR